VLTLETGGFDVLAVLLALRCCIGWVGSARELSLPRYESFKNAYRSLSKRSSSAATTPACASIGEGDWILDIWPCYAPMWPSPVHLKAAQVDQAQRSMADKATQ